MQKHNGSRCIKCFEKSGRIFVRCTRASVDRRKCSEWRIESVVETAAVGFMLEIFSQQFEVSVFFWKFYCLLWLTFEFRFEYLHKFGSCVALYAFITIGVNFLCISLLLTILTSVFFFLLFSFHRMASITTISKETVNNGLNVVIDTQMCSWRCARNAIQYVSDSLNCNTIRLYAVRPEVFWDKQRVENCTKAQKYLDVSRLSGICGWEFRVRLKCIKLTNHAHFNLGDSRYEISTTEVLQS